MQHNDHLKMQLEALVSEPIGVAEKWPLWPDFDYYTSCDIITMRRASDRPLAVLPALPAAILFGPSWYSGRHSIPVSQFASAKSVAKALQQQNQIVRHQSPVIVVESYDTPIGVVMFLNDLLVRLRS